MRTARPLPSPARSCIHEHFSRQAGTCPDSVAIIFGEKCMNYRELDLRSNQLARYLQERGVAQDTVVGVFAEGAELILSLLAILKAGGAYMPLDPASPTERMEFMLNDARSRLVLASAHLSESLPLSKSRDLLLVNPAWPEIAECSNDPVDAGVSPESLAYVMYTSGSTGSPKGVEILHRGVTRLVLHTNYIALGPDDVVAQASNVAFDASTFEIWGALLNGARLAGIKHESLLRAADLESDISRLQINTLFLTSALFNQIAHHRPGTFHSLKNLIFGGEPCDPRAVEKVLQNRPPPNLINAYGPTEATTFATFHRIDHSHKTGQTIPIGRPVAHTEVLLLDSGMKPVKPGKPGEIYIGGPGLARGYLRRESLTKERFVPHPLKPGTLLFRSRDLARHRPDGNLEFLGRTDHQVKLRGFRIELDEVLSVIRSHPSVVQSEILVSGEGQDKRLVAYVVAASGSGLGEFKLREHLKKSLPYYSIPAAFVFIASLPITPNGKVDRDALARLRGLPEISPGADDRIEKPHSPDEIALAGVWQEVLGRAQVGLTENFFDIGGNSLLGAELIYRIEERFGLSIPIGTLFHSPTVKGMAAELKRCDDHSHLICIQPGSTGTPLFLVHADGGVFIYKRLAEELGPSRPVYGIEAPWLTGDCLHVLTMEELAAIYIREIRSVQPHGPYLIGGFSLGGLIAHEMARQLSGIGERMSSVIMFDTMNRRSAKKADSVNRARILIKRVKGNSIRERFGTFMRLAMASLKWRTLPHMPVSRSAAGRISNREHFGIVQIAKLVHHKPKPYSGVVAHYLATTPGGDGSGFVYDDAFGWQNLITNQWEIHRVPGDHGTILAEPHVRVLGQMLSKHLEMVDPAVFSRKLLQASYPSHSGN